MKTDVLASPELDEDLESIDPVDLLEEIDGDPLLTTLEGWRGLEDDLCATLEGRLKLRPRVTTTEAVEKIIRRVMPAPVPGPYDWRNNPVSRVPQDAFMQDWTREISIMGGARTGKTAVLMNCVGVVLGVIGGAAMLTYPVHDVVLRKVKEDLIPMLESSELLKDKVLSKTVGMTSKERNTNTRWSSDVGVLMMQATQSNSGTKSSDVKFVFNDEVDRTRQFSWGNPLAGLRKRQSREEDSGAKTMNMSTLEGDEKSSIIHGLWMDGDQTDVFCDCPNCGFEHTPDWENVSIAHGKPEPGQEKGPILSHGHSYVCRRCGVAMSEPERMAMIRNTLHWKQMGEWDCRCGRRVDPRRDEDARWQHDPVDDWLSQCPDCGGLHKWEAMHRSFRQNILHGTFMSIRALVEEFRRALKKPTDLINFWNERFNRPFTLGAKSDGAKTVRDRLSVDYAKEYGILANGRPVEVPPFVKGIVMAVDPGRDHLEAFVGGFGNGMRFGAVHYERIDGMINDPRTWAKLEKLRNRLWHGPDGALYQIQLTGVDVGDGTTSKWLHLYIDPRKNMGVMPIRGTDVGDVFQKKRDDRTKFPHFPIGKLAGLNLMLMGQRLPNRAGDEKGSHELRQAGTTGPAGCMVFPTYAVDEAGEFYQPFDDLFWKQYTNAQIVDRWTSTKGTFGKEERVDSGVRVEAADTGVYLFGLFEHLLRSKDVTEVEDLPFQCARPRNPQLPVPEAAPTRAAVEKDARQLDRMMASVARQAPVVLPKPQHSHRNPASPASPRANPRTRLMRGS